MKNSLPRTCDCLVVSSRPNDSCTHLSAGALWMTRTDWGGVAQMFDGRTVVILSRFHLGQVEEVLLKTIGSLDPVTEIVTHYGYLEPGEEAVVRRFLRQRPGRKCEEPVIENWSGDEHLKNLDLPSEPEYGYTRLMAWPTRSVLS